jgi:2-polyprenyl-3-methyl-5-hydroxy-6-metoxy-1,4-benzoquinol methylase
MLETRAIAEEMMDDPNLSPEIYANVMHDLAKVNTLTLARRPTLAFLDRVQAIHQGRRSHLKILDVGFGDGDMLRSIARWARKNAINVELVGVDLNPRSAPAAQAATPAGLAISWQTGDYADLAGQGWDLIISSLVAHHMTRAQLLAFLRFMQSEARCGWFINDLHRHSISWLGYPILATLMRWHPIVRHDGRLSIARSYRPNEWPPILAEADISGAQIARYFPFRLCVAAIR